MRSRWYLFGAGLIFGTLLAIVAARLVDPAAGPLRVRSVSTFAVFIIASGIIAFLLLKSMRWGQLLRPLMACRVGDLFPAVTLGSAANYMVPHVGELLRVWVLDRNGKISHSVLLTTIAFERVLDIAAIALAGTALLLIQGQGAQFETAVQVLALGCALCFAVIVALLRDPTLFLNWGTRLFPGFMSSRGGTWVAAKVRTALEGLAEVRASVCLLKLLALSVAQWACVAFCIGMSLHAAGVEPDLGACVAVLVLLVGGLALPSAPGHVGTTQMAFLMALEPLGYRTNAAVAASIIYNVVIVAATVAVALVVLIYVWPRLRGERPGLRDSDL